MASESPLNVRTVAGVATLTLDRPKIHNAFDDLLIDALIDALRAVEEDDAVRVVVLTGEGASFSAGADLNWMKRMAQASEKENRKDARQLAKLMRVLNHLDKPTIARVNGAALGGGVGLVACCDSAIASDEARFGLTETRLGLVPAVISPYVIDAIGARHARRLFLTAQVFDAAEAARIGVEHLRREEQPGVRRR
jgi:methylglutaconyl-CoA hydratase